ncbi:MAG: hypothetical protein IPJ52_11495 [Rhodocyclaceae bacterium]|nr:hypothetical protein [Rhodocyclaceae bacterium]
MQLASAQAAAARAPACRLLIGIDAGAPDLLDYETLLAEASDAGPCSIRP